MTPTERDELDSKVMAAIRGGACRLVTIAKACGVQGLAAINASHPETCKIDRSLQRLRKAGRIQWTSATGWKEMAK